MLPERKNAPRLHDFDYLGPHAYSVTCATFKRTSYFTSNNAVALIMPALKDTSSKDKFAICTYCFMPDHLHLLVGGDEQSLLPRFVQSFKQTRGFQFKKSFAKPLWQRGYYEHVLRKDEALRDVARYILNNPVRAGIVDDYRKYPYSGSFVFDINQL